MREKGTGKTSLFQAVFGPETAGNRAISSLFGTFFDLGTEFRVIEKSRFRGHRKALIMKELRPASDKMYYVNYS